MKKTKYGRCNDSTFAIKLRGRCGPCRAWNINADGCPLLPNSRTKPKHGRGSK